MTRPLTDDRERRSLPIADLELRVSGDDEAPRIAGYAAVFNQPSEIISDFSGTYREFIAPGAFAESISKGADVRALVNHDPNYVLGRTKNGTLTLREDSKGLWYEVTPPDTQWARDLITTMRRGDIDQSSFAFRAIKEEWGKGKTEDGRKIDERTVLVAQVFDVSPVTYPAYPQSSSAVRSLLMDAGLDEPAVRALDRLRRGLPLSDGERSLVRAALAQLNALLPPDEPVPSDHSEPEATPEPAPSGHSVTRREVPVLIDADRAARLRARLDRLARP